MGLKFPKIFNIIITFISFIFYILIIVQFILPPQTRFWKIFLIFIGAIIISFLITWIIYKKKYNEEIFKYPASVFAGILFGQFFFLSFGIIIPWNSIYLYILFILVSIIICVLMIIFIQKKIVNYIFISFACSYIFVRVISILEGHFPNEYIEIFLKSYGEEEQLYNLINWKSYAYYSSIVVGTLIITSLLLKENHFETI